MTEFNPFSVPLKSVVPELAALVVPYACFYFWLLAS